jgi:hypothetical protein
MRISLIFALVAAIGCKKQQEAGPSHQDPLGLETIPDDEPAAIAQTAANLEALVTKTYPEGKRPALRDAHAKAHGCVKAAFTVPALPAELAVGLFETPKTYDAWIRYSNGNNIPQPDAVGDGRGMAIKVMGVPGAKILEAEEDAQTQDFLMINHPVFFVDTAANYVEFSAGLESGDPVEYFLGIRNPKTWHLRGLEIAQATRAHHVVNPLETRYYSMAPYLFGDRAVKWSAKPCTIHQGAYEKTDSSTFLADNMEQNLQTGEGCFELLVQLQTNAKDMPVEDPTVEWSEEASPFRKVADIRIPAQSFRSPEQQRFCENLSMTPWHGLPEHRPLGGINRLRRVVYETISKLRHQLNQAPREEPSGGPDFLDDLGTPSP